jgi:Zn-dependent protease
MQPPNDEHEEARGRGKRRTERTAIAMATDSPRTQKIFGLTVHGDFAALVGVGCLAAAERFGGDVEGWAFAIAGAIAAHELGQLAALRAFHVVRPFELGLHGAKRRTSSLLPWQTILISLAGPLASALVALLVFAFALANDSETTGTTIHRLGQASIALAAIELLPLLPFDGGVALSALLEGVTAGHGERVAQRVSLLLGLAVVVAGAALSSEECVLLGGLCVLFALLALRKERIVARDREGSTLLASAKRALDEEDDLASARRYVTQILGQSDGPQLTGEASELGAWIELHAGDARAAAKRIGLMPSTLRPSPVLRALLAHVAKVSGDSAQAGSEDAAETGHALAKAFADTPAVGRVVPALVAFGRADEAAALVTDGALEPEWLRTAAKHLFVGRAYAASALVSQRAFERTNLADHAYNAGCALAQASRHDDAVEWLAKASIAGFADRERASRDVDLEALRTHAGFATWLVSLDGAHPYRS